MRNLLLLSVVVISSLRSNAQLVRAWDKRFGGYNLSYLQKILPLANGNILLAGYSYANASFDKTMDSYGDNDFWIVCIDSIGNFLWDQDFGGDNIECLTDALVTNDNGFLFAGYSLSDGTGSKTQDTYGKYDYWIVKTDSAGNEQWNKAYGGAKPDFLTSVCKTLDGGYLLGGYSISNASGVHSQNSCGGYDYWVVKIDSNGTQQWDKRFGGYGDDDCYDVYQSPDGNFYLSGYTLSGAGCDKTQDSWGGLYDYWVVKISETGEKIWDIRYGTSSEDLGYSICGDGGNGIVVAGISKGGINGDKTEVSWGYFDYWLLHLDSAGNKLWDKTIGGSHFDEDQPTLLRTEDAGYLVIGTSYSGISGNKTKANLGLEQTWMFKCDSSGNFLFDNTVQTYAHEEIGVGAALADGCYLIGNASDADSAGDKTQDSHCCHDYFIAKFCMPGIPQAIFKVSDSTLCAGGCANFTDLSVNNPSTWNWSFPGATPSSVSSQNPTNICYDTVGIYPVTLEISNPAGSDSVTYNSYIQVLPSPPVPIITQLGDTLLCSPAYSYQWLLNSIIIPGATDQFYVPAQFGLYSVIITNAEGCSAKKSFEYIATTSNFSFSMFYLLVTPNPSSGEVQLQFTLPYEQPVQIQVFDIAGKELFAEDEGRISGKVSIALLLNSLAEGSYFVNIIHDGENEIRKLIVGK